MKTYQGTASVKTYAELLLTEGTFSSLPGHAPVMEQVAIQRLLETARWHSDLPEVERLTAKLAKSTFH
jgi:hypothetical protein